MEIFEFSINVIELLFEKLIMVNAFFGLFSYVIFFILHHFTFLGNYLSVMIEKLIINAKVR